MPVFPMKCTFKMHHDSSMRTKVVQLPHFTHEPQVLFTTVFRISSKGRKKTQLKVCVTTNQPQPTPLCLDLEHTLAPIRSDDVSVILASHFDTTGVIVVVSRMAVGSQRGDPLATAAGHLKFSSHTSGHLYV